MGVHAENQPQVVARYGHLYGIEGIAQGKRLELLPYVAARSERLQIPRSEAAGFDNPFRSSSEYFGSVGLDLKYRLGTNLTLDGAVNPDFGQVELDPAVINLTAFETRFDEKRPFYVEGAEIFRFGEGGGRPRGSDAQLLYSRRIGRTPQGLVPGAAAYSTYPGKPGSWEQRSSQVRRRAAGRWASSKPSRTGSERCGSIRTGPVVGPWSSLDPTTWLRACGGTSVRGRAPSA